MPLPENIRVLRKRRVLSQRDLANKTGLSRETICRIETGKLEPSPDTIRKIALALGVRPEELLKE